MLDARTIYEKASYKAGECEAKVIMKSGNKNPDFYKTQREWHMWKLIAELAGGYGPEDYPFSEEGEQLFRNIAMKEKTVIDVHEGDNALDLLAKYKDVKDIWNKLNKACDEAGLKIVGSDIVRK